MDILEIIFIPISLDTKRFDGTDKVQIQVDGTDETTQKVEELTDRNGIERGEVDVGGGERQREPAVERESETKSRSKRQFLIVHDQKDALKPTFALLQKVPEREGRLLPHLAVYPVERVAFGHGRHGKVRVLGYAALWTVVERHRSFRTRLTHDKRTFKK